VSAAPAGAAWTRVCRLDDLRPERGAAALVGDRQIALFRLAGPAGEPPGAVAAIANRDPFSGANVLARGIVGSAGARVYVASPMYKQRFDLRTGDCLDAPGVAVETWPARVVDGWVEVRPAPAPGTADRGRANRDTPDARPGPVSDGRAS
jgi:nitrite reductase (NADH) small subunit